MGFQISRIPIEVILRGRTCWHDDGVCMHLHGFTSGSREDNRDIPDLDPGETTQEVK